MGREVLGEVDPGRYHGDGHGVGRVERRDEAHTRLGTVVIVLDVDRDLGGPVPCEDGAEEEYQYDGEDKGKEQPDPAPDVAAPEHGQVRSDALGAEPRRPTISSSLALTTQ